MGDDRPIRVTVISENAIIREGIVHVLEVERLFRVRGISFKDLYVAVEQPDVVVAIVGPRHDLEAQLAAVRSACSFAKLACLFLVQDDAAIITALRAGATGIIDDSLAHSTSSSDLISAVKQVAGGQFVLSTASALRLVRLFAGGQEANLSRARDNDLTQRELEVLDLLADGRSNRDIANRLSLSEHTVRAHLRGIMQKLQVSNRVQAAALAWEGRVRQPVALKEG